MAIFKGVTFSIHSKTSFWLFMLVFGGANMFHSCFYKTLVHVIVQTIGFIQSKHAQLSVACFDYIELTACRHLHIICTSSLHHAHIICIVLSCCIKEFLPLLHCLRKIHSSAGCCGGNAHGMALRCPMLVFSNACAWPHGPSFAVSS